LRAEGNSLALHDELLSTFQDTQRLHVEHRDRLRRELDDLTSREVIALEPERARLPAREREPSGGGDGASDGGTSDDDGARPVPAARD
jgi:hypothetical protein